MTDVGGEDYLRDYADLLRWLADQRDHNDSEGRPNCGSVGACVKCRMLAKAELVEDQADAMRDGPEIKGYEHIIGV